MTLKKRLAYLAVGTVAVAGMSGAFGTAAFAADESELPTSGAEFTALAQSLLAADDDVQAVAADASGNVVVYSTTPAAEFNAGADALVQSKSNVVVKVLDAPITAYEDEVVGGAGYAALVNPDDTRIGLCSIGFTGFSPSGDPAVISAGHCTKSGEEYGVAKLSALTLPTGDTAGGGGGVELVAELGTLAFSQFGGTDNSAGSENDVKSVDISAWDVVDGLNLAPKVTDWTTASTEDLSLSTISVGSVGEATAGASISKSGRTTGFTTGTVDAVKGWANVSGHWVYGFMSTLVSDEGDSGGSMIQGDTAVGVVSGGTTSGGVSLVWGADLEAGLALTDGYTVAVSLDAPELVSPGDGGDVYAGGNILGTGPAGATLEVTPSEGDQFDVTVDGSGDWAFPAPGTLGEISYSIRTTQGFSTSSALTFDVNVVPAPLVAPVITSPTEGQSVEKRVSTIRGTGEPGATVTLTGAVEGTALVGSDGTWSVDTALRYGTYTVSATQTREDAATSDATTVSFQVAPVAPAIVDPKDGTGYDQGSGPKSVSGTGTDGATVSLSVNGSSAGKTTVEDGTWSIPLSAELGAGTVVFTASQSIEGVTGKSTTSTITVTAVNNGGGGSGGGDNGGSSAPAGNGGSLANTGGTVTPLLGGGLALLVAAGGVLLVSRRLKTAQRNS